MDLTRHQGPILIIKPYGKFLLPKLLLHLAHWPSCYNYFSFYRVEKEISFPLVRINLALFLHENWFHICHISFSVVSKLLLIKLKRKNQHRLLHCRYLEKCISWRRFLMNTVRSISGVSTLSHYTKYLPVFAGIKLRMIRFLSLDHNVPRHHHLPDVVSRQKMSLFVLMVSETIASLY